MAAKKSSRNMVDNWQSDKSIVECLRHSLDKKIVCDVVFNVGEQRKKFEAHRLILSLRSTVFMSMLYGAMAAQADVVIPDIEPSIFEEFLQFLYTDHVVMDGSNVIGLLYASRKYDVETLEQQCISYLDTSMTSQNSCTVLEQAHLYEDHILREKAFNFICDNGDAALNSDAVVGLCKTCLDDVIQSDDLKVNEQTVFEAVLKWSEAACRNLGREVTPANRRQLLGDAALHLRYPILSQDYFADTVIPTNILTESEGFKIMRYLLSPKNDVSPFNAKQRNASSYLVTTCITRFDIDKSYVWEYTRNYDDAIMFSINTNAALLGFQLYGAYDDTTQSYDVTAFLTNASTDEKMDGSSITTTVIADTHTYDILFPQAVHLKKNVKYCLIVNIKGPNSHQGNNGKSVIKHGAITCSFFDYKPSKHSNKESNSTKVDIGQIPSLIFRV